MLPNYSKQSNFKKTQCKIPKFNPI
uniref:Uncharacterized protein n=1 Tax=Arundo donax TaxID=35708 RepID=A0A0A9C360_ARUDO